ncbi:MAG: 4Fe-4S double cluster binding domain-containing protein [Acetivibrionales bacterium]|jgi:epoxyqueuosine reductase
MNDNCFNCNDRHFANPEITGLVRQKMADKGYAFQMVPIERLEDLRRDVENLKNSSYFNNIIDTIITDFYNFSLPDVPFKINSIIIAASPSPMVRINFNWKKKKVPVLLPPTYMDGFEKSVEIENLLKDVLKPHNFNVVSVHSLPKKLLGVRSGLSVYGRNNISYIDGMGSFANLSTYYSDITCTEDNWHEIRQMDSCGNCGTCLDKCPTSAITSERYLYRVERCLAYHNEFTGLCDFPQWMDPKSHNCIVGCLRCQVCCPKNKEFLNNVKEFDEFSYEETMLLLEGRKFDEVTPSLAQKIKRLNLVGYFDLLPRNLKALLDKEA